MSLAISALGFWIYTRNNTGTWEGLKQLEKAKEFSELLIKGLRPHLAERTFYRALERRNRNQGRMKNEI